MKLQILVIVFSLVLPSPAAFAVSLTPEEADQIILQANATPEQAADLAILYPQLAEQIIRASSNPDELTSEIAHKINWREFTCLEKDKTWTPQLKAEIDAQWTEPENTKTPNCFRWSREYSDNPSTDSPIRFNPSPPSGS